MFGGGSVFVMKLFVLLGVLLLLFFMVSIAGDVSIMFD